MKAKKYITKVSDSAIDRIHNFSYTIKEIFIPELKICFNEKGYVFQFEDVRTDGDVEEIEIDDFFAKKLKMYVERKNDIEENIKSYFKNKITEYSEPIDLDLPNDVLKDLYTNAHENEMTLNEYINYLLEEYVDENIEERREI